MPIRIQRMPNAIPDYDPEVTFEDEQAIETHHDGMTFAWGPAQVRNFADDGVGKGHQVHAGGGLASIVREDGHFATSGETRS